MTLFTTLQSLVPQQKISEIAGRLAQSRHPMVKKTFIRTFASVYGIKLEEYARGSFSQYDSLMISLPVSSKTARARLTMTQMR